MHVVLQLLAERVRQRVKRRVPMRIDRLAGSTRLVLTRLLARSPTTSLVHFTNGAGL